LSFHFIAKRAIHYFQSKEFISNKMLEKIGGFGYFGIKYFSICQKGILSHTQMDIETSGRRILVVDDNPEFADIVSRVLSRQGCEISVARSGRDAIDKVSSESPELVLLDLKLPDISGGDLLKRIKGINEDTSVIIITGYGGEQVAVELMKAGAVDFLSKPLQMEVLIRAVRNALQIRDAQVEDKQDKHFSSLEKFFPFLAHEIRNPLHAIGGALAIIQRRSNLKDEFLAKSIHIIQEEVQHLNEFVQECLEFVRPPMKSRFIEVEIEEVINVVMNMMSHMFEDLSKKIKITTEMDSQHPKIYANYEEIKRAFLNIVKNSFDAMGEGGGLTIKAFFIATPPPGIMEIVFKDTGSGIPKDKMKNLFDPFFTTKLRGTGLGLAICHRIIVDRHHGRINIESEEGKGTTVKVELPLRLSTDLSGDKNG
jgi:signal transduction histidine kinase